MRFQILPSDLFKGPHLKISYLDIGSDRSQREPWFLHFPFSVILPYGLFKGDILFFCIITQQYWWLPSKHTHFSWQTAYFTSVDTCIFLELCLCASFSGISLTPLREFGLEIWFEIELASLLFLLFPPFALFSYPMSTYTTAVPCFSMPGCSASFHQPLNTHMI